jgi:hypothetical protein
VYLPAAQAPSHSSVVVVHSLRPDADVIAAVREAVARLDPDLPVYAVRSMQDVVPPRRACPHGACSSPHSRDSQSLRSCSARLASLASQRMTSRAGGESLRFASLWVPTRGAS